VLGDDGKHAVGLNHPRARNLALVADPDAWFTCYWPTTGSKTRDPPDFAPTVEIHRKPGYDPAELFFNRRQGQAKAALRFAQNTLGFRNTALLCTDATLDADRFDATDAFGPMLDALR